MTAEQVAQYAAMAEVLERQELTAVEGGHPSPQVYGQLLAIYLLTSDLQNAKLLWKRIPANLKDEHLDLTHVWSVGQALITRDFPSVYQNLSAHTWPGHLNNIMNLIREVTRQRVLDLVSKAYSTIHIDKLSTYLGVTVAQNPEATRTATMALITPLGWVRDQDDFILPNRSPLQGNGQNGHPEALIAALLNNGNEEQLAKLTEYVSFLENY